MSVQRPQALLVASIALVALLALSGVQPYDRTTWVLEVFPVAIALPVLWLTYRRFPLTTLVYVCIFLHALVLMIGGAYTYARVPLGFYLADLLDLSRNPYDKIGHFFQGFVPALDRSRDPHPGPVRARKKDARVPCHLRGPRTQRNL